MGREGLQPKTLRSRETLRKKEQDVIILVDGSSSVTPNGFQHQKQFSNALSQRLDAQSQVAIIQFGEKAELVCSLSLKRDDVEARLQAMAQIKGGTNLLHGLELAGQQLALSSRPNNAKQIWIVTDGDCQNAPQTATYAQKLKREKQATIFMIGVGHNVSALSMDRIATLGCSFLVKDFESAFNVLGSNLEQKELSVQIQADLLFPNNVPIRLGEETVLKVQVENTGLGEIPRGSRLVFKGNTYFKEKVALFGSNVPCGQRYDMEVRLQPITRANRANLDAQLLALPAIIEFFVVDNRNNEIATDCTAFYLNHEDFTGDIYLYSPIDANVKNAVIVTFGPPGSGKSSFVNTTISALGDHIQKLSIAGASRNVVTSSLLQFPLNQIQGFEDLQFALYDIPGLDGKNYRGQEIALVLHGLMPPDVDFKHEAVTYNTIKGRRSPPSEEAKRNVHVVTFFVPQGVAGDSDLMDQLAAFYYNITVEHKRKAIVVISHADEVSGEDDRKEIQRDVCNKLSIDASNVFFLENYVDTKDKKFEVDKNALRIVLAMLSRADDFMQFDKLNPVGSPFPPNTYREEAPPSPAPSPSPSTRSTPSKLQPISSGPTSSAPTKVIVEPPSRSSLSGSFNDKLKVSGGDGSTPTTTGRKNSFNPPPPPPPPVVSVSVSAEGLVSLDDFLERLPGDLRDKVWAKLKQEDICDDETLHGMKTDNWRNLDFKMGEIMKIEKALGK